MISHLNLIVMIYQYLYLHYSNDILLTSEHTHSVSQAVAYLPLPKPILLDECPCQKEYAIFIFYTYAYNQTEKPPNHCLAKNSSLSLGLGLIVSAPGVQLAGHTSPCSSVNWNALSRRRVSSTDRPTGKSFTVI